MRLPALAATGAVLALFALSGATPAASLSTASTTAPGATTPTTAPGGVFARACRPATLPVLRTYVGRQVADRLRLLGREQQLVAAARSLTAADRAALTGDLSRQQSGLGAYTAKVAADTTCAALLADAKAVVTDYRVYVVTTPQVRITGVADAAAHLAGQLAAAEPRIDAAIDRAAADGVDVTAARQAAGNLATEVDAAQNAVSGLSASVLAYTPASFPGCWTAFQADRQKLTGAVAALRQAWSDVTTIRRVVTAPPPTTTTAPTTAPATATGFTG